MSIAPEPANLTSRDGGCAYNLCAFTICTSSFIMVHFTSYFWHNLHLISIAGSCIPAFTVAHTQLLTIPCMHNNKLATSPWYIQVHKLKNVPSVVPFQVYPTLLGHKTGGLVQYRNAFMTSNLIGWVSINLGCCQGDGK